MSDATNNRHTLTEAAKLLGVSRKTLSRWKSRGMPHEVDGRLVYVDVEEVRAWAKERGFGGKGRAPLVVELLRARLDQGEQIEVAEVAEAAGLKPGDVDGLAAMLDDLDGSAEKLLSLAEAIPDQTLAKLAALGKARKDLADAAKKEIDLSRLRGELVSRDDVDRMERSRISAVRVGLEGLGAKLRARLASVTTDPPEVERITHGEVNSLLDAYVEGRDPS